MGAAPSSPAALSTDSTATPKKKTKKWTWPKNKKKKTKKEGMAEHYSNYDAGAEPEWTREIPSWVICDWFYMFFIVNAIVLLTLVISLIYMTISSTIPKALRLSGIFMLALQMLVSGTSTLFFYLICDRSLKPSQ